MLICLNPKPRDCSKSRGRGRRALEGLEDLVCRAFVKERVSGFYIGILEALKFKPFAHQAIGFTDWGLVLFLV